MKRNRNYSIVVIFFCCLVMVFTGCKKDDGFSHKAGGEMRVDDFVCKRGGGGTEVLISGTNFSSNLSEIEVTINGNKLAVIGANGKQIMAVVPKKCGSGKVVVKIGNDIAESEDIFNYVFTRTVSTLAGNGVAGFANGNGTDAMFNFSGQAWYRSMGIAVDDDLNVYVADPGNACIRKIDSEGSVTTLAGNPNNPGYQDGRGASARFSMPYDVAVDQDGNVYSVDPGNWDIRKISPDGEAVTWLWAGQEPWSVAVDPTTNDPYYASVGAGGIHHITGNMQSTEILNGLVYPAGIDFDQQGNLYVVGHGEHVIRKYAKDDPAGVVIAGQPWVAGYAQGPGAAALFANPWGIAVDLAGNVYTAGNGTWDGGTYNADQGIRFISAGTWEVSAFAGSGSAGYADAIGEAAAFSAPTGVAVDKNGTVYVLDKNNNRVRKIVSE